MKLRERWTKAKTFGSKRWVNLRKRPAPWIAGLAVLGVLALGVFFAATQAGQNVVESARESVGSGSTLEELLARAEKSPDNARLHVALGRAQLQAGQRRAAFMSYDKALALNRDLVSDELIADLIAGYGTKQQSRAHIVITRHKLVEARRGLARLTKHPKWLARTGAVSTLEKLGKITRDDYLNLWVTDLGSSECKIRQYAVEKLGGLGDQRALEPIRLAKKKDDEQAGWFGPRCIGGRASDAEKKILASR